MQQNLFETDNGNFANPALPTVALDGFREVSQDEFYKIVGTLDATLSTLGNYPYTTEFKLRHGRLIGKSVDSYEGEYLWPQDIAYFRIMVQ